MKFTDEKTQELFDDLLAKSKGLEEVSWYKDDPKLMSWKMDRSVAFAKSNDAFISHVESRLNREGEPCEWETKMIDVVDGKFYLHDEDLEFFFCPRCGRSLEAK